MTWLLVQQWRPRKDGLGLFRTGAKVYGFAEVRVAECRRRRRQVKVSGSIGRVESGIDALMSPGGYPAGLSARAPAEAIPTSDLEAAIQDVEATARALRNESC